MKLLSLLEDLSAIQPATFSRNIYMQTKINESKRLHACH